MPPLLHKASVMIPALQQFVQSSDMACMRMVHIITLGCQVVCIQCMLVSIPPVLRLGPKTRHLVVREHWLRHSFRMSLMWCTQWLLCVQATDIFLDHYPRLTWCRISLFIRCPGFNPGPDVTPNKVMVDLYVTLCELL